MNSFIELQNVSVEIPIFDASRSFRQTLANRLGGELGHTTKNKVCVHALRNLSFRLETGDRLGLIGHNGAGKTTLLRLLAHVYKPTRGRYIHKGRITSLLNVNLGMEMDDTGLENIYTVGMFLGMSRKEVVRKRDEIIEVSELGDFINLPVRTYSAGMVTRLSFALVTALEKDILLMDEGIGAGDARFANKAQERLNGFYRDIGILVIASHSDTLVKQLCSKAILMEHGAIIRAGSVDEVLEYYRKSINATAPTT